MAEWYETPPEQRTDEQRQRAQQAYYRSLLSSRDGKEVICDMKRRVSELIEGSANNNNCAIAQLWLEGFLKDTLTLCGLDNMMEITKAQARIARSYVHKEEEPDIPEGYAE